MDQNHHSTEHGALVRGGQHGQHNCYDAKDGFSHLQAHVATSAFDSADQVDAPKCHPNTREAVQEDIMNWVLPTVMRIQWMLWLNGAAGSGKSAIARSIVALCLARNIPIARFFFFRTDSTRNNIQPLVATLVHQLIQQIPNLLAIVIPKIESDPLIFTKSLETQLQYLIFEPLRQLHHECPITSFVVLLFDGVDECAGHGNQTSLVRLIASFLSSRDLPIVTFFGSRVEYQLQQVFRSHDVSTNLHQLALDDNYHPADDIRLFLSDKFMQIKTTHPLNHLLRKRWPDPAHVEEIVDKSSGQFVYASVVVNFVSSPRQHPGQQLEIIRGLRPVGKLTPFAQLDALYKHILSQVVDNDQTSLLLAWAIFTQDTGMIASHGPRLEFDLGISSNDISVLLADLSSILSHKHGDVHFLHASLPDFLLDSTRSQAYYLDKGFWCTRLSICCYYQISEGSQPDLSEGSQSDLSEESQPDSSEGSQPDSSEGSQPDSSEGSQPDSSEGNQPRLLSFGELRSDHAFESLLFFFLPYAEGTSELREHALALDFNKLPFSEHHLLVRYLSAIRRVDFGDGGELYQSQLDRFVRHIAEHPDKEEPYAMSNFQKEHDISAILAQIESEKTAELALQRTDETGQESTALEGPRTSRASVEHGKAVAEPVADADADVVSQRGKAQGGKGAAVCNRIAKSIFRRILKLGRKKNTAGPSNKAATEVVTSTQKRGTAEVKSWFG